ncbi:MAG: LON peptidase substrate-binding domain-containing protein, partial [Myxococcota bacterium]
METTIAALPLRGMVLLPGALRAVPIGRPTTTAAVEHHLATGAPLLAVAQVDPELEDPTQAAMNPVGVLCTVSRATRLPDGGLQILLEGQERVYVRGPVRVQDKMTVADYAPIEPTTDNPTDVAALADQLARLYGQLLAESGMTETDARLLVPPADDPTRFIDQLNGQLDMSWANRLALVAEPSPLNRLQLLVEHTARGLATHRFQVEISTKVQAAMDQSQREYQLREQLKVIRQQLGDAGVIDNEADAFQKRIEDAGMPDEVKTEALREVERLRRIHSDSAEYSIVRTWLEAICDLPWVAATTDTTDLVHAQTVLDEDHYGLDFVKERILEYLAVRKLKPDS